MDTPLALPRARTGPTSRGIIQVVPGTPDFMNRSGDLSIWVDEPPVRFALAIDRDELLISCSLSGSYLLEPAGRRITAATTGDPPVWEHRLACAILPLFLSELGDLCLHAAAVDEGEGAVLYAGASGAGKSTLAGARAIAGRPILAEDGVALDGLDGSVRAWPGARGIRVSPDAWVAMGGDDVASSPVAEVRRRERDLVIPLEGRDPEALPVRAIAVLEPRGGETVDVERLDAPKAIHELLYCTFFAGPTRNAATFGKLAELVGQVPVYGVRLPDDLPGLVANSDRLAERLYGAV